MFPAPPFVEVSLVAEYFADGKRPPAFPPPLMSYKRSSQHGKESGGLGGSLGLAGQFLLPPPGFNFLTWKMGMMISFVSQENCCEVRNQFKIKA